MDKEAWCDTVHGFAKSWTQLKWTESNHNVHLTELHFIKRTVIEYCSFCSVLIGNHIHIYEKSMATQSRILAWRIPMKLAWWVAVHDVAESDMTEQVSVHTYTYVCVCVCVFAYLLSHVQLFVTPWTGACQVHCPWGFSRQEYWTRLPSPPPGHLLNPDFKPSSPALQLDSLCLSHQGSSYI